MDIRTLLFADLVLQLCCGTGLLLMSRGVPGLRGLRWFGWAFGSASLGIVFLMHYGLPEPYAVFVGRLLTLCAAVLLTQGVAEFISPRANSLAFGAVLVAVFAAADSWLQFQPRHQIGAIITFGVAFAAQLLAAILMLLAHQVPGEKAASRSTAALLAGVAMLSLTRALLAPLQVAGNPILNETLQFGGVVLYMIFSAGLAFGFVWMTTARLRNQLEMQAQTDSLTGVLNRRALEMAADREISACRRRGTPLALLAIDLDHFKRLNDTHGHAAGDAMLAAASRQLQRSLRSTDFLARFGGEEFIAVLPDRDGARAFEIAERLRSKLEELQVPFEGQMLRVTASFGVASLSDPGDSWTDMQRRADRALYAAKQGGRNCTRAAAAASGGGGTELAVSS